MHSEPVRVVCERCGWRTTRVYAPCECDGEYGCHCGSRVYYGVCKDHPTTELRTIASIKAERAFFAALEKEAHHVLV